MSFLPQDPIMLLSYVNTKLRDEYSSLRAFCEEEGVDQNSLMDKLKSVGYEYDEEKNKFI